MNDDAPKPAAAAPDDPDRGLDAWIADVQKMKGSEQARAVQDKLRERNPNYRDAYTPTFYQDQVVELLVDTRNVTDISPVRALKHLMVLALARASSTCAAHLRT